MKRKTRSQCRRAGTKEEARKEPPWSNTSYGGSSLKRCCMKIPIERLYIYGAQSRHPMLRPRNKPLEWMATQPLRTITALLSSFSREHGGAKVKSTSTTLENQTLKSNHLHRHRVQHHQAGGNDSRRDSLQRTKKGRLLVCLCCAPQPKKTLSAAPPNNLNS